MMQIHRAVLSAKEKALQLTAEPQVETANN